MEASNLHLLHRKNTINGRLFRFRLARTHHENEHPCPPPTVNGALFHFQHIKTDWNSPSPIIRVTAPQCFTDNELQSIGFNPLSYTQNVITHKKERFDIYYQLMKGKKSPFQIPTHAYEQIIRNHIHIPTFIDDVSYFFNYNFLNISEVCNKNFLKQYVHIVNDLYLAVDYSRLRYEVETKNLVLRKKISSTGLKRNVQLIKDFNINTGFPIAQFYAREVEYIDGEVLFVGPENFEGCLNLDGSYDVNYFESLKVADDIEEYFFRKGYVRVYVYKGLEEDLKYNGFRKNIHLQNFITVKYPDPTPRSSNHAKNKSSNKFYTDRQIKPIAVNELDKNPIYDYFDIGIRGDLENPDFRIIQEFPSYGILYTCHVGEYKSHHDLLPAFRLMASTVTNQGNNRVGLFWQEDKIYNDSDHQGMIINRKYDHETIYYKSIYRNNPYKEIKYFTPTATHRLPLLVPVQAPYIAASYDIDNFLEQYLIFKNKNVVRKGFVKNTNTGLIANQENLVQLHVEGTIIGQDPKGKYNIYNSLNATAYQQRIINEIKEIPKEDVEYYTTTCYRHRAFMHIVFKVFNTKIMTALNKISYKIIKYLDDMDEDGVDEEYLMVENVDYTGTTFTSFNNISVQTFKHFAQISQRLAHLIWRNYTTYLDVLMTKEDFITKYPEYGLTYECHEYLTGYPIQALKHTMNMVYNKELNFSRVDAFMSNTVIHKILPLSFADEVIHYGGKKYYKSTHGRQLDQYGFPLELERRNAAIQVRYLPPYIGPLWEDAPADHPAYTLPGNLFKGHFRTVNAVINTDMIFALNNTAECTMKHKSICRPDVPGLCSIPGGKGGPGGGSGIGGGGNGGIDGGGLPGWGDGTGEGGGGNGGGGGGGGGGLPPDWTPGELIPTPNPPPPPPIFGNIWNIPSIVCKTEHIVVRYFFTHLAHSTRWFDPGPRPTESKPNPNPTENPYLPDKYDPVRFPGPRNVPYLIKGIRMEDDPPGYKIGIEYIPYWIVTQKIESGLVREIHASSLNSRNMYHTRFFIPEYTKFKSSNQAFAEGQFVYNASILINANSVFDKVWDNTLEDYVDNQFIRWLDLTKFRALTNAIMTSNENYEYITEQFNIIVESFVDVADIYTNTLDYVPDLLRSSVYSKELSILVEPSSSLGYAKAMRDLMVKLHNIFRTRVKINLLVPQDITDVTLDYISKMDGFNKFIFPIKGMTDFDNIINNRLELMRKNKFIPMIYATSFSEKDFAEMLTKFNTDYGMRQIIINDEHSLVMTEKWKEYFKNNPPKK